MRDHYHHIETAVLEGGSVCGVIDTQSARDAFGRFKPEGSVQMLTAHFSFALFVKNGGCALQQRAVAAKPAILFGIAVAKETSGRIGKERALAEPLLFGGVEFEKGRLKPIVGIFYRMQYCRKRFGKGLPVYLQCGINPLFHQSGGVFYLVANRKGGFRLPDSAARLHHGIERFEAGRLLSQGKPDSCLAQHIQFVLQDIFG